MRRLHLRRSYFREPSFDSPYTVWLCYGIAHHMLRNSRMRLGGLWATLLNAASFVLV